MTGARQIEPNRSVAATSPRWLSPTELIKIATIVLLGLLLVGVLFESWLRVVLAERAIDASGHVVTAVPAWPPLLRNGIYITLAILATALAVREWTVRRFVAPADIALGALVIVLVLAGVLNGSGVLLTAEGVFVYLRGVIVLYAIRALDPPSSYLRALLWLVGAAILVNAAISAAQLVLGRPVYEAFGLADLKWAATGRALGLQDHPNHLGHVVGLMVLGMLAWFLTLRRVAMRWWAIFALLVLSLAASQSRESLAGVLAAVLVLAVLRRGRAKVFLGAIGLIVVFVGVVWVAEPSNWAEFSRRIAGVANAIRVPSGSEDGVTCSQDEDCTLTGLPRREVRVLYIQQGMRLWLERPILGYGVGQFGGAVAFQDDPQWYLDPRFGPSGFDTHGFDAKQVDSFWLHLLVETGAIGSLAYITWYLLLAWPFARLWLRKQVQDPRSGDDVLPAAAALWVPAALTLGAVLATLSPALEDSLFPPLLFGIVGIGWVTDRRLSAQVRRALVASRLDT